MREADFAVACEQLALLLRSGLPLPESLREMGGEAGGGLAVALRELSEATAAGESLSAAMAARPAVFGDDHVAMVAAGEKTDSLPEMLAEIAELSLQRQQAANRLREIAAYPMVVIYASAVVFVAMQAVVTPGLQDTVAEFGVELSGLAELTFASSEIIAANWQVLAVVLAVIGLFGLWLLTGPGAAVRLVARLVAWIPGGRGVLLLLDLSRTCRFLTGLLGRGEALPDALASASGIAFDQAWGKRLRQWGEQHAAGTPMATIVETLPPPDPLLGMALTGPQGEDPAASFSELAELYDRRADIAASRFAAFWTALVTVTMFAAASLTIWTLFAPLVVMLEQLGS